jgi:hypothetical protein
LVFLGALSIVVGWLQEQVPIGQRQRQDLFLMPGFLHFIIAFRIHQKSCGTHPTILNFLVVSPI